MRAVCVAYIVVLALQGQLSSAQVLLIAVIEYGKCKQCVFAECDDNTLQGSEQGTGEY